MFFSHFGHIFDQTLSLSLSGNYFTTQTYMYFCYANAKYNSNYFFILLKLPLKLVLTHEKTMCLFCNGIHLSNLPSYSLIYESSDRLRFDRSLHGVRKICTRTPCRITRIRILQRTNDVSVTWFLYIPGCRFIQVCRTYRCCIILLWNRHVQAN